MCRDPEVCRRADPPSPPPQRWGPRFRICHPGIRIHVRIPQLYGICDATPHQRVPDAHPMHAPPDDDTYDHGKERGKCAHTGAGGGTVGGRIRRTTTPCPTSPLTGGRCARRGRPTAGPTVTNPTSQPPCAPPRSHEQRTSEGLQLRGYVPSSSSQASPCRDELGDGRRRCSPPCHVRRHPHARPRSQHMPEPRAVDSASIRLDPVYAFRSWFLEAPDPF